LKWIWLLIVFVHIKLSLIKKAFGETKGFLKSVSLNQQN